ncbi:uncharacterized protein LTR77_011267 [Saxophila tyrrhenica]|uniref:Uncharacterized protein n=1 Tax=Saxophila tyrrhenica TaxID=1690608 RepID=A0AAV9NVL3_9PEZI|nr:hypothetical protein LTR77_011267 [Saxophila tyrrhenica]
MCTYSDPICPACECKHRTTIATCAKYNIYNACPIRDYGPFLFKFCTRCADKYMDENKNLCVGEMMFLTSDKPMTLDTIIHVLETGYKACSRCSTEVHDEHTSSVKSRAKMPNALLHLLENVAPARVTIMNMLSATNLATVCYACPILLTNWEKETFLKPIRDLPEQEEWIRDRVAKGSTVKILGANIPLWLTRIRAPSKYWSRFNQHTTVAIWIMTERTDEELDQLTDLIEDIQMTMDYYRYDPYNPRSYNIWDQYGNVLQETTDTELMLENMRKSLHEYESEVKSMPRPPGSFETLTRSDIPEWHPTADAGTASQSHEVRRWFTCPSDSTDLLKLVYGAEVTSTRRDWMNSIVTWVPPLIVNWDETTTSAWDVVAVVSWCMVLNQWGCKLEKRVSTSHEEVAADREPTANAVWIQLSFESPSADPSLVLMPV